MFHMHYCKVDTSFVLAATKTCPTNCDVGTTVRSDLNWEYMKRRGWLKTVEYKSSRRYGSATIHNLDIVGSITPQMSTGKARVWAVFGVECHLSLSIWLGTPFIHRFVRRIIFRNGKMVLNDTEPLLVLLSDEAVCRETDTNKSTKVTSPELYWSAP